MLALLPASSVAGEALFGTVSMACLLPQRARGHLPKVLIVHLHCNT